VGIWSGHDPSVSGISLPSRRVSPLQAVASRAVLAFLLLVVSTIIVYLGRNGYKDAASPGQPLNLVACAYYSAVTLSTTGYGDIVPVTTTARVVNTFVITPIRVVFLILLIGTTLEVLTERTRMNWRISRWRSRLSRHTVLAGYGTKGRNTLSTLREAGTAREQLVVVDIAPQATAEANRADVVAITGDATRREVLASADIESAAQLIIAVDRDDTAVLIALTARQLNPDIAIGRTAAGPVHHGCRRRPGPVGTTRPQPRPGPQRTAGRNGRGRHASPPGGAKRDRGAARRAGNRRR
jgi:voltage-gated potassium channel